MKTNKKIKNYSLKTNGKKKRLKGFTLVELIVCYSYYWYSRGSTYS